MPELTGKGCLYVSRLTDIDLDVLRGMIESSVMSSKGSKSPKKGSTRVRSARD